MLCLEVAHGVAVQHFTTTLPSATQLYLLFLWVTHHCPPHPPFSFTHHTPHLQHCPQPSATHTPFCPAPHQLHPHIHMNFQALHTRTVGAWWTREASVGWTFHLAPTPDHHLPFWPPVPFLPHYAACPATIFAHIAMPPVPTASRPPATLHRLPGRPFRATHIHAPCPLRTCPQPLPSFTYTPVTFHRPIYLTTLPYPHYCTVFYPPRR